MTNVDPTAVESRRVTAEVRASLRLWGLDWDRVLPWDFYGIRVEAIPFDEAVPFMRDHYSAIFGTSESRFFVEAMTEAKLRFCREMDVFAFRDGTRIVGLFMANPIDWSTYYMRSVAVLPEYRERRLLTTFMDRVYEPLRAVGVERVEGECAPTNVPMLRMLVAQNFLVTSTAASDRWGMTVRFTKFLRPEPEEVFLRQFNNMPLGHRAANNRRMS